MREDVQNVEDKVPIFGDIPIIGRLFQTNSENRIKSNLIVFVTAQIIDATGRPLRGADAGGSVPVSTGVPRWMAECFLRRWICRLRDAAARNLIQRTGGGGILRPSSFLDSNPSIPGFSTPCE